MSSLVGGTGIIGQDMVCGFGKKIVNWFDVSKNRFEYILDNTHSKYWFNLDSLIGHSFKNGISLIAHFNTKDVVYASTGAHFGIFISLVTDEANIQLNVSNQNNIIINGEKLGEGSRDGWYMSYRNFKGVVNKYNWHDVLKENITPGTIKISNILILEGDWRNKQIPKYLLKEVL